MPTYEYECQACGHTFEKFQSMTDKQIRTCPECKKRKVQRLVGAGAGIIFKGSGFYETDYKRKDAPKDSGKSEAKSAAKSDTKSETKSDSASASSSSSSDSSATKSDA